VPKLDVAKENPELPGSALNGGRTRLAIRLQTEATIASFLKNTRQGSLGPAAFGQPTRTEGKG